MFFKSRALRLLLASLLLFSQQQAVLHLLGHSFEQLEKKKDATDPQEQVCAKCLALAHLDHAVAGSLPPIAPLHVTYSIAPALATGRAQFAFVTHYRGRAPPVFS